MAKSLSKKPLKKPSARAEILRTEQVPVTDLKVFHKNPRIGDIEKIARSLETNGQFRAIVVNVGTHTGRKNEVLAGNHSFLAARKLGWPTILATFVDVDDARSRAIVLADNKTAELVLVEVRLGAGDRIVEVGRGGTRDGDLEVLSELQGAVTGREAAGLGPESSDGRVDGREERNESEELHGGSDVRYEERKEWMA